VKAAAGGHARGAWRRLDLGGPAIGFRRHGWSRQLGRGLAIGAIGLGVALVCCAAGGAFVPALRYPPGKTLWKAFLGLLAAGVIGGGEEALFRGVLLRRLGRDAGIAVGVVVTTAIYAAVHAIRTGRTSGAVWRGRASSAPSRSLRRWRGRRRVPTLASLRHWGSCWRRAGPERKSLDADRHPCVLGRRVPVGRLLFVIRPQPAWLVGAGGRR
jgi:hypothetical protein